jgi:hypothetical protein
MKMVVKIEINLKFGKLKDKKSALCSRDGENIILGGGLRYTAFREVAL